MTLTRKVMWKEGMFLRPHHFQQQDLRTETALAARIAALQPFHWGFSSLEIDEGRLAAGQVGLTACAGAFSDGAPFAAPGDSAELAPVAVGGDVKGAMVWLAAPSVSPGAAVGVNEQPGAAHSARFAIREVEVADALKEGLATEPVELGALTLRLAVGERPEGFDALPVARVLEVAQGRVKLDADFVPPIMHVAASPRLRRATSELAARFDARAALLAGPLGAAGGLSAGANQQLMLLQLCNAKAALFAHLDACGGLHHPEALYGVCVEAAAEIVTFTDKDKRRAPSFPAYDHDDLGACFTPVLDLLFAALGALDEPEARQVPLEFHRKQRIHYNRAIDETLLEGARIFLVGSAAMPDEEFRQALPANVSIGSTGEILEIMSAAGRSVPIRPLAHFPPELRQLAGWVCFELDRNAPSWRGVREQRTIAIHAQEVFQDLKLQLWAVKD